MGNSFIDELNDIARDSNGKLKKLSEFQLRSAREEGKFSVESMNFEGQSHVWELNRLLQMGKKNVETAFHKELAIALSLIIVSIPNRIYSDLISIKYGFKSIYDGIIKFPYLVFGITSKHCKYSDAEIDDILYKYRQEFILTHLLPNRDNLIPINDSNNSQKSKEFWAPIWQDPLSKLNLDFRLYDSNILDKIMPVLNKIQNEARDYISKNELEIRKQLFEEFSKKYSSEKDIYQNIEDTIADMENNLFISKINESEIIKNVCDPEITNRILTNLNAFHILAKLKTVIQQEKEEFEKQTRNLLLSKYPIRSKIREWIEKEVNKKLAEYEALHTWDLHDKLEKVLLNKGFLQEAFIVAKDLEYRKLYEHDKRKELKEETLPSRTYEISRPIINPKNWIIRKNEHNNTYYAIDYKTSKVSSGHTFWRWSLLAHRTRSIFKYSVGIFLYTLWASRLGIRGLFSPSKFYPFKIVDPYTGNLTTDFNRPIHSLVSSLKYIWEDIRSSVDKFEAQKDDGLLGKSVSRIFHRIWNYGFKGIIGSSSILIIQPTLTILNLTISIPLLILSPFYSPLLSFLVYLTSIWIYDFDSPTHTNINLFPMVLSVIAKLGITGIGQIILALFAILVLHPLSSFAVLSYATMTTCFRRIYDAFMYYCVLRSRARVPARDTFLARRISGPGLSNDYFYQVEESAALIALQANLESMEINYFKEYSQDKINEPQRKFTEWYHSTLAPIGAQSGYHLLFSTLDNRKSYLTSSLNYAITQHKQKLQIKNGGHIDKGSRIRMTKKDLSSFLSSAQALIENFAPRLFDWRQENLFWGEYKLENNDWCGLTLVLVKQLFSEGFLIPLEETDQYFSLSVKHTNVKELASMIKKTAFHDHLDVVVPIYTYKTPSFSAKLPLLSLYSLQPNYKEYEAMLDLWIVREKNVNDIESVQLNMN